MLTKTIEPIMADTSALNAISEQPVVVGTQVKYRIFGILICRKTMYTPAKYGLEEWQFIHKI